MSAVNLASRLAPSPARPNPRSGRRVPSDARPSAARRPPAACSAATDTDASPSTSGRGGGTPGSWNLGVAHSAANKTDQRGYVDRLFKAYGDLVAAAESDDLGVLATILDDAYTPAPDASTAKIRDAQLRAAALAAVAAGAGKTFAALLDRGADLGVDDDGECQLAVVAASAGREDVLDTLFHRCKLPTETRNAKGRTALMAAAAGGHVGCVARCVDAGANVNAVDASGEDAATLAAGGGHAGCLNALRAAGADVERPRESDGMTALGVHRAWVANLMNRYKDASSG